jgi:serine/threonine-protein kinase
MALPNESTTATNAGSGVLSAVRSTGILTERQLEKLESDLADGQHSSEPGELFSRLVKDKVLTEFQAHQIQKGRAEGLSFGSYLILDFLGRGTMGKVYKARHRMMGRVVALKILDSRYVSSRTRSLARFQREMQLVGRLDHPNVVRAFDADRVADCYFIAMEYAAGYTLEDLLKSRGALPPADVVYYASQVADGLAHAHSRGVIHRDVKPSNILLTDGKKVKILDFGLGTLLETEDQSSALTTAGMAVGTPDYISPEQARMVKIDGRSDLYSLGCTIYHLLSGQLPFKGESSMDCIVGRITGAAVPITDVRPGLPPRLIQCIEKLMAPNPEDRYQTADEAATALRSMLRPKTNTGVPAAPTVAPIAPTQSPAPNGRAVQVETGAKADSPREAPEPLRRATVPATKPKSASIRSRGTRVKPILATVAVAAVLLAGITFAFFGSSPAGSPETGKDALQPNNGLTPPAGGTNGRQSGLATENTRQAPAPKVDAGRATESSEGSKQAGSVTADARTSNLVIESPKGGATVGMREELTGRIESGGWPVIFVQADIPGQPWWCQAPVASVENGRFTTAVVFGDDSTPPGTRFRIAGILAPSHEEALKFDIGSKQRTLPPGFPQSLVVVVARE